MYIGYGYIVFDADQEPLRGFEKYAEARHFVSNKPDCKVKKQHIDFSRHEECLL